MTTISNFQSHVSLQFQQSLNIDESATPTRGVIVGYAAVFDVVVETRGVLIERGAFAKSLARHKANGTRPAMLWGHDTSDPIGHWTELTEDRKGLLAVGQLNLSTDRGRTAFEHLRAKDVDGLSIGFEVRTSGLRKRADDIVIIGEVDLLEISVVSVPANDPARVSQVHSVSRRSDLERMLREQGGLSRAQAFRVAAAGWPAMSTAAEATCAFCGLSENLKLMRNRAIFNCHDCAIEHAAAFRADGDEHSASDRALIAARIDQHTASIKNLTRKA